MKRKIQRRRHHVRYMPLGLAVLLLGYVGLATVHAPALSLSPTVSSLAAAQTTPASALNWPSYGQAAVGADSFGVLDSHGSQTPTPTASTAKIMTTYAILKTRPLAAKQYTTPLITLTQKDVDIYNQCIVNDCSVALVAAGEQISEYQALQAIMLPSANNMATSMAIWAFGSLEAYTTYANGLADELGLANTHIADASGYSPATVSTATDLVKLSIAAMKDPVFADIVSQSSAVIPVAGKVYNVNGLLGRDNIVGLKTGNTEEAGGVFVAAATHEVNGQTITVITAVMGGPTLVRSMLDSLPLLASAKQNFAAETVLEKDAIVGYYSVPWINHPIALKTASDITLTKWKGTTVTTSSSVRNVKAPMEVGSEVGAVVVKTTGDSATATVVTSEPISAPSLAWRLRHPL